MLLVSDFVVELSLPVSQMVFSGDEPMSSMKSGKNNPIGRIVMI
jgi:hypothetical protein